MSRWYSYLNSATAILQAYQGEEPLGSFLKKYFAQHSKFGGQDRKWISQLCYSYFRLGKSVLHLPAQERILFGLFLTSRTSNGLLAELRPDWNVHVAASVTSKADVAGVGFSVNEIFPFAHELSAGIDHPVISMSFLEQPDLFLRVRPGFEKKVRHKLDQAGIIYTPVNDQVLGLPNNTKVDAILEIDSEAVVQDISSQKTGDFLRPLKGTVHTLWDCCAASGGKSLMAWDILGKVELTVSDIRSSILANLKKRFAKAGIGQYDSFVADLTEKEFHLDKKFDLIIADVPCTGSGTWGRTPEQLYYFDPAQIGVYAARQKKILQQVIKQVRPGGYLLYCTCSVFGKENEEQVLEMQQAGWQLHQQEMLKGYEMRADTLFAALLQKPL